jgi:diguanylate cyclase (GGDEF)-like protein
MLAAPALNEPTRLELLRTFDVLDARTTATLERLAHLATRLFHAPIALVSFVDDTVQRNPVCIGLNVREADRRLSFCAHALDGDGTLVVPDTALDVRFADNPFVTNEPRIRFYAGAVLEVDGQRLGTLCVMDTQPRTNFDALALATLSDLALGVTDALELRRANTRLRVLEGELRAEQRLLTETFAALEEGVVVQDSSGQVVAANASAAAMLGLSMDQLLGRTSVDPRWHCVHGDGTPFPGAEHPVPVALHSGVTVRDVLMGVHRPDGGLAWLNVNARPLRHGPDDAPYAAVGSFTNVTERVQREAKLEHLVYHDPLTGLPNRAAFLDRLERLGDAEFAIGFLDLDSFKSVNDRHGHDAGDELLRVVSTRLARFLRTEDMIARLSGDEFALLLRGVHTAAQAERVKMRLLEALEPVVRLRSGVEIRAAASVGFSFHPRESTDVLELLRLADTRMYADKAREAQAV